MKAVSAAAGQLEQKRELYRPYTAVNFEWIRPAHLHPGQLGPPLPGDHILNEFGFFDEYSWNSTHSQFTLYHALAFTIFLGLLMLVMAVLFHSSALSFLSFFVYQKHHRQLELKLNETSKTPDLIPHS
jgi:hypothetical protein